MKSKHSWHAKDIEAVLKELHTDAKTGLSEKKALIRLEQEGFNELITIGTMKWYAIFLRQFLDVLILILFIAALISLLVGELGDALTIFVIIFLNGIIGFVQEYKAGNAIEALRSMLHPTCTVIRNGTRGDIDAKLLVPGDIVLLEIGDRVPADVRIIKGFDLKVDESSLTGESESVYKSEQTIEVDRPLAQQSNRAWMGTAVVNGRALAVVVATGMNTEFGKIAMMTQTVKMEATPLQKKLAVLGKTLGIYSVSISITVALAGWILGKDLLEMFLTGVALAVAVVPEGLPAVVTITLALGIKTMAKRKALLRRLQAAETLGAATVICTDKTGTLTQNEMTVTKIWLPTAEIDVTGIGYDPKGHFEIKGEKIDYRQHTDLLMLLKSALLCNHAQIQKKGDNWEALGEPTEAALVAAAYKAWLHPSESNTTVSEFSFNSSRKRMSVILHEDQGKTAYVKGAPEVILDRSTKIFTEGKAVLLDEQTKADVVAAYKKFAKQGLRTLGISFRILPENTLISEDEVENDLVLVGIVGIIDPPHIEVEEAIKMAQSAGIKVIMITGDNPDTATSIANSIGLAVDRPITSSELASLNDKALVDLLKEEVLFARARPEDKLRIVNILKEENEIVAMTGDGVNDAPALKEADIGISMGKKGTDVAKSASDIVLSDDNFASIINAVEEGRREYNNIQKFVQYLMASNSGEVIAIFVNIIVGGPLILIPVQILWMNLVTDGMTAIALGVEPADKGIMKRPPRAVNQPILDRYGVMMILVLGSYVGLVTLWLFHYYLELDPNNLIYAQTIAFTGIILLEKMIVLNFRSLYEPIHVIGFFTNKWLLMAIALTISLQAAAVYVPFLQDALHTTAIDLADWGLIIAVSLPVFIITEIYKWIRWKRNIILA